MARVAVAGLLLGSLLCARQADAQPREPGSGNIALKQSIYADDDETQIYTTLLRGSAALPGDVSAGAHVLIDVISSASVDVVTAATRSFDEVRLETGLNAGIFFTPEVDLGVGFVRSAENDWESYSASATLGIDMAQRNTRLIMGYGFGHNAVGRAKDPNFNDRLLMHTAELAITQVADEKTLLTAAYTFQVADGWLSSPYRFVTTGDGRFSVLERHPDLRIRHGMTLTGLRYLTKGVGLRASYRFYADDWGVLSNTASASLRGHVAKVINLRARARFYHQSAASFWEQSYPQLRTYMSSDRELSTFWNLGGGFKVGYQDDLLTLDLKSEVYYYRFLNFNRLPSRVAVVADAGVGLRW